MANDEKQKNLLAICDQCGSVFAAGITDDGKIYPLGVRNGCQCGGRSFSPIEKEDFNESLDDS